MCVGPLAMAEYHWTTRREPRIWALHCGRQAFTSLRERHEQAMSLSSNLPRVIRTVMRPSMMVGIGFQTLGSFMACIPVQLTGLPNQATQSTVTTNS